MADVQPIARRGDKPVSSTLKKPPPKGTDQKHPAGIFADMATDGPIIGTLVAVVDRAKNLPNLKSIGKQDPYCVLRLGKNAQKTEPDKRGGQTPKWDAELRFPVHDSADYRNLKIVIFTDDKKTELIGETVINLDNILDISGGGQSDGWHQCKCRGRYAGDIRVELTFWDSRPREAAPLVVNTRQITGFEKEDFKRPEKQLAGPRRPGGGPRKLPEKPTPKAIKENAETESEEEEEEAAPAQYKKERERHRDREPRERHRSGDDRRQGHREHRREKSRHARESERREPEQFMLEYDHDGYQSGHNMHYEQADPYGHYRGQDNTLQDFQSDHIGRLQAQYVEQTQVVPHQRHSPNPAAYPTYQQDPYGHQQWQQPIDHSMGAMVLASQNAPPPLPQHRHVEFADNRRSMALPTPQPQQTIQHRKSRSEFYPSSQPDLYQQTGAYSNQLVSSSFAPQPPRHSGYDQQYAEQPSYVNGFEQQQQQQIMPTHQISQQTSQYQIGNGYQANYQDQYPEQSYQTQLVRANEFAPPPPPPQHNQASSYSTTPIPRDDFNSGALALSRNMAPAPPPPAHRNMQPRMSMPAAVTLPPAQQPPFSLQQQQQSVQTPQPIDIYEQGFQVQSLRGFAPPVPSHGESHGSSPYRPTPSPQPMQLQPPLQEQVSQARPRGNSEPPPYATLTDNTPSFDQPLQPQPLGYAQQVENPYSLQQNLPPGGYSTTPRPSTPAYTSITDYSQAGIPLSQRLSNLHLPQNPEHAFDPTTALVLAGGGPPPLPSHSGSGAVSPQPMERGRPTVPPISTNAPPRKPLSRSPSPHPLSLTPGYGPDSPGDGINGSISPAPFTQQPLSAEAVPQSNYHAPYVKDVTGRRSMDSTRFSLPGNSPLIQPVSQPLDANRRRSVSPMPPLNSYSQDLVSTRGAPPPLPPPSHRMSQQLVYKHDPSERPSDRSNRNSAYDLPAQPRSPQPLQNNNGIPGAQTSNSTSSSAPIPVARDRKRQPYIEDEIDETDRCADSTYQSASTSWTTSQSVDDFSREHMNAAAIVPSYDNYSDQPPPLNMRQSQYSEYNGDNLHMAGNDQQAAPIIKPRATSPIPGRRNSDLPPAGRTPEPEQQSFPKPVERRMTLGATPFSPDDYDIINPVSSNYGSGSRSPSGNVSTSPLARSPGALAISPGQYMTPKEERKARKEEEKAAKKARKKFYTPNSANRELGDDDILAPETFAREPGKRDSFNGPGGYIEDEVQPLTFRPRRQSASPQPPGADVYGTSPGGRGYKGGPKSIASNASSTPSSGYGYGGQPAMSGGSRPLPGAPVMRNAIMGPDDYYNQQPNYGAAPAPARPMQPNPGNMTSEQWSLSQELSSINIGSSRRRTGTWA
ncbi:hypothetical protein ABW19_dt0203889 [Dactylella cylindrospora]|nr:hypothetical protein ABW19_dt0203889 [Dactylella cylindrospora]